MRWDLQELSVRLIVGKKKDLDIVVLRNLFLDYRATVCWSED